MLALLGEGLPADALVCNLYDTKPPQGSPIFISKSVRHPDYPPGKDGRLRFLNTFVLYTEELRPGVARLVAFNYADFQDIPVPDPNKINVETFSQGFIRGLQKYVADRQ